MSLITNGTARAVFFDLDGTLVDTAPDMVELLQEMQAERHIEPVDYALGRSFTSHGSNGLLDLGFGAQSGDERDALQAEFLSRYRERICDKSTIFPSLAELLQLLDGAGHAWGVVTNKPAALTEPLLASLALLERSSATISGDTLDVRKPDPGPLLHACQVAGVAPAETIYVGDASRDIEAGLSAGTCTIGAAYGYVTADDDPETWGAELIVDSPEALASILIKAFNL